MRVLAQDNRILWINVLANRMPTGSSKDISRIFSKLNAFTKPLKEVERNIFVLSPLAIPTYGNAVIRSFNRRFLLAQVRKAMRKLKFKDPVNMVFNPAAGLLAGKLGES
ncbi:MAG: glycosyltransferase family 1 protein, partial [Pyrinomonadaceae bacterium]